MGTSFSEEMLTGALTHVTVAYFSVMRRLVWLWRSVCHEPSAGTAFRPFSTQSMSLSLSLHRRGCWQGLFGKNMKQESIFLWQLTESSTFHSCDYSDCTFTGRGRSLSSLLVLYGFEFSFILFLFSVPLLPVVENAVQHGLDLWVEARKLLRKKKSKTNIFHMKCYFHLTVYCEGLRRPGQNRLARRAGHQTKCNMKQYLVDKRADKVDETTLQLWKLCRLVPVHHGLVGTNRK